ncbi:MAG TPA: hypothetical protein VK009_00115 [Chloroflexota bacterium]|nr:hypothetical protein [Chloroflexota bacterium]
MSTIALKAEPQSASAELEHIPQPIPIYMLGESHCVVFTDRIFRETRYLDETFITRALYLPGISSHDFSDNNLQRVWSVLAAEHLIVGDPRGRAATWVPFHVSRSPLLIPSVHNKKPRGVPIIVVFAGEIALRSLFLKQLGQNDFDLPFPVEGLDALPMPEGYAHVQFNLVLQLANQILSPLLNGLMTLYNVGFTSLYVHSIPPPTLSDEEFEKINGFFSPVRLRYKAALLFNRIFRDLASQTNIRFLDIWDEVTIHNALNPEFHIDGTHLNVRAAYITLQKLITSAICDPRPAVAPRYQFADEEARSWFAEGGKDHPYDPRFTQAGLTEIDVGAETTAIMRAQLDFTLDTGNRHVRLDWSGSGPTGSDEGVFTAEPTTAWLGRLYDLMYSGPVSHLIHGCLQADYAIISARPLSYRGAIGATLESDGCPQGVLHCALVLKNGTALEYAPVEGAATKLPLQAGQVVVFDGNRLRYRWLAGSEIVDMVLLARHKRLERCVIWPGMNLWPVDPFNFSMRDFVGYSPSGSFFRLIEDGAPWWLTI